MVPSPCSDPHEQGGSSSDKNMTTALITYCHSTIVYAGKCYKALINSRATISLVRYSTYKNTDNNKNTAIQSTWIHLNTADGSPMIALGITTLQLWMVDFKFSHSFFICDRLPNTEILFGIDVQKEFALSYTWDWERNCYIQMEGRLLT